MFTLKCPVVSHVGGREARGQDVGAVLVPLQVAAAWGEGLPSENCQILTRVQRVFRTLERTVFIWEIESKLVEDMKPSRLGGLHGVEPFWKIVLNTLIS